MYLLVLALLVLYYTTTTERMSCYPGDVVKDGACVRAGDESDGDESDGDGT
jgi:hypothetical protein